MKPSFTVGPLGLVALAATLVLAAPAHADTLVLANGREVHGTVVEETDSSVTIEVGGGRVTFVRSDVARITKDPPKPAGAKDGKADADDRDDKDDAEKDPKAREKARAKEREAVHAAREKIVATLEDVVGASIADLKKKYAPTSEELESMRQPLHDMGNPRRRAGPQLRRNGIEEVVGSYGLKALVPLAETLDSGGLVAKRGAAIACGRLAGAGEKDDGRRLLAAAAIPEKVLALLDEASQARSGGIRLEANAALEAIYRTSMGWPSEVAGQDLTPEEVEAKGKWAKHVAAASAEASRLEAVREETRGALGALLRRIETPKSSADRKKALAEVEKACAKAKQDLAP